MNVILSIRPDFVQKILSGEKQYEYRKIIFRKKVNIIYIYATRPIGKIVGQFKISNIIYDDKEVVWDKTHCESGITKEFYDKYYHDKLKSVAIGIKDVIKYHYPLEGDTLIKKFKAPQSFMYTDLEITK